MNEINTTWKIQNLIDSKLNNNNDNNKSNNNNDKNKSDKRQR
jgi:hypothetical protein